MQLQCHFGMETLQWARIGATVTGVDFSPAAIEFATSLAIRSGLEDCSNFVCSNVYDAPVALAGQVFDVVYVTIGSLSWLPDVRSWATVVATLLAPGGQLYLFDVHPFSECFDDDGVHIVNDYFEDPQSPLIWESDATYTDGPTLEHTKTYSWNHSLAEITQALLDEGLSIEHLVEHDWTMFQQFPWLEVDEEGIYRIPLGYPRLPLTFTLHARS